MTASTALVNTACSEFLAGASVTGNQDGGVRSMRNLVDAGLHLMSRSGQTDQLTRGQFAHTALHPGQLALELSHLQTTTHYGEDAMRVAHRRQEVIAALVGPEGEAEMRLTRIPASELRRDSAMLLDAIKSQGFFPGPRVAFVEDATDGLTDVIKTALDEWREGVAFAFDDTIDHEAWNGSDDLRVVLIFDVWNPHLSLEEQQLLKQFYATADASKAEGLSGV